MTWIDWSVPCSSDSIDIKIDILNNELSRVYDVHAPARPVRDKRTPASKLSPETDE